MSNFGSSLRPRIDARIRLVAAAEILAAGTWVAFDADYDVERAENTTHSDCLGLTLNGGATGEIVMVVVGGSVDPDFAAGDGFEYFLGVGAEAMLLPADLASGANVVRVGYSSDHDTFVVEPHSLDAARA